MKSILSTMGASFAVLALASGCAADPQPLHATPNTIVITNTGSTNTIGYRILISSNGQAAYVTGAGSGQAMLESALVDRFRRDIEAASPLANLPVLPCPRSASFGTSTFVTVGDDRSPDLNCRAGGAARALQVDVAQIIALLKIGNVARDHGKDLPPASQ